jgi:hypothetical protein
MSQDERDFDDEEEYPQNGFDDASYDDEDEDFDDEDDFGNGDADDEDFDEDFGDEDGDGDDDYYNRSDRDEDRGRRPYRDEIFSKRGPAGKRTYFFDVKTTRSGRDYFLTITESKKVGENRYEKHKIFLYKEDFGKFVSAMHETVRFIQDECLPGYEFRGLPDVSKQEGELEDDWSEEGGSY